MPAFTAIGAYVVGALGGAAVLGTVGAVVVGSIVATGAAYITSRIINGNANKGNNNSYSSQGGRVQVPPATNNKVPVLYGSAFVNGAVNDARLINENKTMFYSLVLAEKVNTTRFDIDPTYTLEQLYWNDLRLTPVDSTTNAHKVKDGRKVVNEANDPPTSAGSFVVGKTYVITSIGTTTQAQWNTTAGSVGQTYGIGSVFLAVTVGTGTGTAQEEDFIDTNFLLNDDAFVQVRVYAGSGSAADQIYPPQSSGNTQNAWDFWADGDNSWDSTYQMKGLVFAVVRQNYSADRGFTSLPNVTFQITNNIVNPADVWYDYMTSQRYGAGLAASDLDLTALAVWDTFCNDDFIYTDINGQTNQVLQRYTINGLIDTSFQVKTNIDSILNNGGAWMSYNVATGLWSPVIKKAVSAGNPGETNTYFTASVSGTTMTVTAFPAGRIEAGQLLYNNVGSLIGTIVAQLTPTTTETQGQIGRYTLSVSTTLSSSTFYTLPASVLAFSDDNIISGITISATRLEDLYNQVEVEFYNKYNKDQKDYARIQIPASFRNQNEPDNQLRMSLDLVNNSVQSQILGNIEMRQSREDLSIDFTSNFYGIQAQAGDVISVYSDLYNWYPKYFRVIRVKEIEDDAGGLVAKIQALEYNSDVYTLENITEFSNNQNIGIPPANTSVSLPAPTVRISEVDADVPIPNFTIQIDVPTTGGPFNEIEMYYTEGWDPMTVSGSIVPGTGSNGAPVGNGLLTVTSTPYGSINTGDYFDLVPPVTILSQLTNTPASKTYFSLGGVGEFLIRMTNLTGILLGNRLTGTGLATGGQIIDIDFANNTVRVDRPFTVQATGSYAVTGGNGTYVVDVSATASGSATLYDVPEDDDYNYLLSIFPTGNNSQFINGETVNYVVTTVPANLGTWRRWFVRARMGLRKIFGELSVNGAADLDTDNFQYEPSPVGGGSLNDLSDVTITSRQSGQTLIYDSATSQWINSSILRIRDPYTGLQQNVEINGTRPFLTFQTQAAGANPLYGIRGKSANNDPWFVGSGSTGTDAGYLEIATGDNAGSGMSGGEIYVRQYAGSGVSGPPWEGSGTAPIVHSLTLLNNVGDTSIPNNTTIGLDLAVNGGDITTTQTTGNLFNATATTVNVGNGATAEVNLGNTGAGRVQIKSPSIDSFNTSQAVFNTTPTTVNAFGAATTLNLANNSGTTTLRSPTLVGTQTTQNLYNTTATTVNAFGAATALNLAANSGTTTLGSPTLVGTQTTQNVYNTTATTVNAFGAGTAITLGATTGTTTIRNANTVLLGDLDVRGGDITNSTGELRITSGSTDSDIVITPAGGGSTKLVSDAVIVGDPGVGARIMTNGAAGLLIGTNFQAGAEQGAEIYLYNGVGAANLLLTTRGGEGKVITSNNLEIQGGNLLTTQSDINVFDTVATGVDAFGVASSLRLGATVGTTTLRSQTLVGASSTQNLYNTVATTVNAFGAATDINIGAATGTTTVNNTLEIGGSGLAINGGNLYSTATTFELLNKDSSSSGTNDGPTTVTAFLNAGVVSIGSASGYTRFNGNIVADIIKNTSGGGNSIELNGTDVVIGGDLKVTGNVIESSTGAEVITMSGNDIALLNDVSVGGEITMPYSIRGDQRYTASSVGTGTQDLIVFNNISVNDYSGVRFHLMVRQNITATLANIHYMEGMVIHRTSDATQYINIFSEMVVGNPVINTLTPSISSAIFILTANVNQVAASNVTSTLTFTGMSRGSIT